MRLSEDRISHLSHKIHDRLYLDELVDYTNEDEALKIIKNIFTEFLQVEDQIDTFVRHKIQTLKKGVVEGSPEWEVLYRKYFEEEAQKRKL
ncbi:MAG TPA: DUF507 domain-containing protein [Deltaproteobacteria bacterium]|nr:MAG: hypothetical protein A2048_05160 [Deltaproteobacteria bacterium GWA2_45_12]HBF12512.1 DUF507 domain-containing protein [Deltaproteobacteria bacterium]